MIDEDDNVDYFQFLHDNNYRALVFFKDLEEWLKITLIHYCKNNMLPLIIVDPHIIRLGGLVSKYIPNNISYKIIPPGIDKSTIFPDVEIMMMDAESYSIYINNHITDICQKKIHIIISAEVFLLSSGLKFRTRYDYLQDPLMDIMANYMVYSHFKSVNISSINFERYDFILDKLNQENLIYKLLYDGPMQTYAMGKNYNKIKDIIMTLSKISTHLI